MTLGLWSARAHAENSGATAPAVSPDPPLTLTIAERGSRDRVAGAIVRVDGSERCTTSADGRCSFRLDAGEHEIEIESIRHFSLAKHVRVGAVRELRLLLDAKPEPAGVIVQGVRREAPARSFSGEQARSTAGTTGDPFRVIESLPGVVPVVWPAAIYSVRGSNPGQTGFFIDELRVPALFHFALGPSVIHPYLIEGIDFYPGVYPARFGGYTSGAIAARTVTPPNDRAHASADVRLYDAGGIVSAPFDDGRGVALVAGRYSYTGALLGLFSDTRVAYADYQARIEHRLLGGQLTLFALGSFDTLSSATDPDQDAALQFHRVDLRYGARAGPGRLTASLALGFDRSRSRLLDVPFAVSSTSLAPRVAYRVPVAPWAMLEFGSDASVQAFRPEPGPFQGKLNDVADRRVALSNAAYVSLALQPTPRLLVTPALRVDEFLEGGRVAVEPEPRINARFELLKSVWLKAAFGRSAQMPSLPVGIPGMEAFGLAQYGPQTQIGGSLGVELPALFGLRLDVNGFFNKMRVTDIRSTDQPFNVLRDNYFEMRNARSYGVEIMVERDLSHSLSGWLAYTLSYSERQVDYVFGPSDWDQRHVLNLVLNQRLGNGWTLGGRFHYHTGRLTTISDWYSAQLAADRRKLPDFYQLDLRVEKKWVMDNYYLAAYAEFANLTATREVYAYDVDRRFSGPPAVREESLRIVLPSLGVRAEF